MKKECEDCKYFIEKFKCLGGDVVVCKKKKPGGLKIKDVRFDYQVLENCPHFRKTK